MEPQQANGEPTSPLLAAPQPTRRRRAWLLRLLLAGLLPLGVVLRLVAAGVPELVEQRYSRLLYPLVGGRLSCLSDRLPFSIAELLLAGLVLVVLWRTLFLIGGLMRRPGAALLALLGDMAAAAGVAYMTFLLLWGLNYQRQPFASSAGLRPQPAPTRELELLSVELIEEANRLRERVHQDEAGVMRPEGGLSGVLSRTLLGVEEAARLHPVLAGPCGRPKAALTSTLLAHLGVSGIYSPFTGEPHLNTTLPAPYQPFSAAHEVAHQRGFAREDEANYIGYLACRLHPDEDFRYSGALAASGYALGALAGVDAETARELSQRRSDGVRRDLAALHEWSERHRSRVTEVSQRVHDAYLKAQGQADGVASYGRMVDLLLAERRSRQTD